jgi:hypothetical protein
MIVCKDITSECSSRSCALLQLFHHRPLSLARESCHAEVTHDCESSLQPCNARTNDAMPMTLIVGEFQKSSWVLFQTTQIAKDDYVFLKEVRTVEVKRYYAYIHSYRTYNFYSRNGLRRRLSYIVWRHQGDPVIRRFPSGFTIELES